MIKQHRWFLVCVLLGVAASGWAQIGAEPGVSDRLADRYLRSTFPDLDQMVREQLGHRATPPPLRVLGEYSNPTPVLPMTGRRMLEDQQRRQFIVEGYVVGIDELLKGLPPAPSDVWQEQGLLTSTGEVWSFVPRGVGAQMRTDKTIRGQYLQIHGIKDPSTNHIQVLEVYLQVTPTPTPKTFVSHGGHLAQLYPEVQRQPLSADIPSLPMPSTVRLTPVPGTNIEVNRTTEGERAGAGRPQPEETTEPATDPDTSELPDEILDPEGWDEPLEQPAEPVVGQPPEPEVAPPVLLPREPDLPPPAPPVAPPPQPQQPIETTGRYRRPQPIFLPSEVLSFN